MMTQTGAWGEDRTVTIVGGGTAGWMAAALLSKLLLRGFRIRLVESDAIGTIGVGEATIPGIRDYNRFAGISEPEFLKATGGTFKLGIEFVDWRRPGDSYIHGFGKIGHDLMWLHTHQLWLNAAARGRVRHFDHFALNCVAARMNRFSPPDVRQAGSPVAGLDYAYHFDAGLYARFLRTQAEARNVERIEGRIVAVDRASNGDVAAVRLEDGRTVEGDLFIDCSGMRALLIGETMGVPFESWSHWLPCDRAVAMPSARLDSLPPFTRSTAKAAGWQWRIPLQHRTGNGYVYASSEISDDQAAGELRAGLCEGGVGDVRPIRFVPGRRLRAWEGNVVALGLAAGFIEPLESTSIHLIQTGLLRLLALFPGDAVARPADVAEYNRQTAFEFEDIRDFLIAHYKVTEREDTPFWRHVKHMTVPDSLAERLALFASSARFFVHGKAELFREESWVQVLIGQGLPMQADPMVQMIPIDEVDAFLADIEAVNRDCAADMPTPEAYLARIGGDACPTQIEGFRGAHR